MLKFQPKYLLFAIILFIIEVCIALFVRDNFVRPFVGDFLVVIFIYCFVKAFLNIRPLPLGISVLVFAFLVETLQYFKIVKVLGLENNKVARIVIGTSFEWKDLLAYTFGVVLVLLIEKRK